MAPKCVGGWEVVVIGGTGLKNGFKVYQRPVSRKERASHTLLDLSGSDLRLNSLKYKETSRVRNE
jgi:hypothetical protein